MLSRNVFDIESHDKKISNSDMVRSAPKSLYLLFVHNSLIINMYKVYVRSLLVDDC